MGGGKRGSRFMGSVSLKSELNNLFINKNNNKTPSSSNKISFFQIQEELKKMKKRVLYH